MFIKQDYDTIATATVAYISDLITEGDQLQREKQAADTALAEKDKEIAQAYFRGLRDAKVMVFRYGCEIGDSKEHIDAMTEAQNIIAMLIDKETMDEARKLVRTWPGYNE
jgi:hypothetical protein